MGWSTGNIEDGQHRLLVHSIQ